MALLAATSGTMAATAAVYIAAGDSLDNTGTIDGSGHTWGVQGTANVDIVHNERSGEISGGTFPVYVFGTTNTFINDGLVSGGSITTYFANRVGRFTNTGGIVGGSGTAVHVNAGGVGDFLNAGYIGADNGYAVEVYSGDVGTFINSAGATIMSDLTTVGAVKLGGNVDTFSNAGDIHSHLTAVEIDGDVRSFVNSGTLDGYDDDYGQADGVLIGGRVTETFRNDAGGTISGDTYGAVISGGVASFSNAGTIEGGSEGVDLSGDYGSFVNTGTIRATGGSAYTAVYVDDSGTLFYNQGTIDGGTGYGAVFDQALETFRNSGTITGGYYGVEFSGHVGSFTNSAGGSILASEAGGTAVTMGGGGVGRFVNNGSIVSTGGNGVSAWTVDVSDAFINTGTISGERSGVEFNFGIGGSFINSGDIIGTGDKTTFFGTITYAALAIVHGSGGTIVNSGTMRDLGLGNAGLKFDGSPAYDGTIDAVLNSGTIAGDAEGLYVLRGSLGSIDNSGTISAAASSDSAGLLVYDAQLGSLDNRAGGVITGPYSGVAVIDGSLGRFSNAGLVHGGSFAGVAISSDGDFSLSNSGTIEGNRAVLADGTHTGSVTLVNSGVLRGTGGIAVDFAYDPQCGCNSPQLARNDVLTLQTGSKIFGTVNFGTGDDMLDFSGFAGNTVLKVPGLDAITAGSRGYVWDKPNDQIAIFDLSGLGAGAIGQSWTDIGAAMFNAGQSAMEDAAALDPGTITPSNYAQATPETSAQRATETAVMTELDTTQHLGLHGWASVLGGGSAGPGALDRSSLYAGIIAGSHARLNELLTLGGMAGLVQSTSSSMGGDQVLNTTTGSVGLYGSAQFGVADIDVSLLAGLSGNQSNRKVVAGGTTETAAGNFLSGTITPSVALSVPVLSADGGSISLEASGSYTAGLVSGYSETGSSMNLAVGNQTIQMIDARVGLSAKTLVATTGGASYALTAKAGVLVSSNFGSSSVPVTTLNQTTQLATPGSTAYGVYTGFGAEAAISETLHLGAHLDGSWRSDGIGSAAAKFTLSGGF